MKPVWFFDDGGVLNDNMIRGTKWKPLLADFMIKKYGGEKKHWMEANQLAIVKMIDYMNQKSEDDKFLSYSDFRDNESKIWVEEMFKGSGIELPDRSEYIDLISESELAVVPHIESSFPNIIETIKILHNAGYTLNTASGASSTLLNLYLERMDVRDCFTELYGSDLIQTMKVSQDYYEKIFERENIDPKATIIIDDTVKMLKRAKKLGANVIQSCVTGKIPQMEYFYKDSNELPKLIERIERSL